MRSKRNTKKQAIPFKIFALEFFFERAAPVPFSLDNLLGGGGFFHFQQRSSNCKTERIAWPYYMKQKLIKAAEKKKRKN